MVPDDEDLTAELAELVTAAGRLTRDVDLRTVIRRHGRLGQAGEVTRGDLAVDAFLRDAIGRRWPSCRVMSEEACDTTLTHVPNQGMVIVVDPIDGSREYAAGRNTYATGVVAVLDGQVRAAAVWFADTDQACRSAPEPEMLRDPTRHAAVSPGQHALLLSTTGWWNAFELTAVPTFSLRARAVLTGETDVALVAAHRHRMFVWDWLPMATVLASRGISAITTSGPLSAALQLTHRGAWYATADPDHDLDLARCQALPDASIPGTMRRTS